MREQFLIVLIALGVAQVGATASAGAPPAADVAALRARRPSQRRCPTGEGLSAADVSERQGQFYVRSPLPGPP